MESQSGLSFSIPTTTGENLSPEGSSEGSAVAESANSVKPPSRRRAAEKNRRLTTNTFFDQLVTLLSITGGDSDIHRKQDKASILCSARNYVRFYHDLSTFHSSSSATIHTPTTDAFRIPTTSSPSASVDSAQRKVDPRRLRCHNSGMLMEHLLQACNGFLLVTVPPGRVMYSSKSTLSCLGVSPSAIAGQLLSAILCQEDVHRVLEPPSPRQLPPGVHNAQPIIPRPRRNAHCKFHKTSGLTTLKSVPLSSTCNTYLRQWNNSLEASSDAGKGSLTESTTSYEYCHIIVATNSSLSFLDSEIAMDEEFKFEMRISKGGRIIEIQKHAAIAIGYTTMELVGASVFDFVHPYHVVAFSEAIESCTIQGCGTTNLYRFFTKGGQWLWCAARGFIACNPWNHDMDHIVLEIKILGTNQVDLQLRNSVDVLFLPRSDESEWQGLCVTAEPPVAQEMAPASTPPRAQESTEDVEIMQRKLKELEKELQMKNSALFDSQIQLLEQQNLLNQERKKFLDLTETLVKELHSPAQHTTTGYSYCKEPHYVEASGYSPLTTHHYTQITQQATPLYEHQTAPPYVKQTTAALHLQQTAPHFQQTSPHLQQTSPHLQQTSLHLQQTALHLQQTSPHLRESSPAPHLQQSSPSPHLQRSSPTPHLQRSSPTPHLQQSSPTPHLQQSSPSPHQTPFPPASMFCSSTQPGMVRPVGKMSDIDTIGDMGLDFIAELCGDQLLQTFPANLQDPNT